MTKRTNYSADVLALNPELADLKPKQKQRSRYEVEIDEQLAAGVLLDGSEAEYVFDDERNWRFDRAWPPRRFHQPQLVTRWNVITGKIEERWE